MNRKTMDDTNPSSADGKDIRSAERLPMSGVKRGGRNDVVMGSSAVTSAKENVSDADGRCSTYGDLC